MAGFLGCGKLYAERIVGGVGQGLKFVGNATKFGIKENFEQKERMSKQCDNYGSALDTVNLKRPADISMTVDEFDADNLARVFAAGDVTTTTVAGATVTDEAVTGNFGVVLQLQNRNITTATIVVTNDTGVTTYVEGTDYEVISLKNGLIAILPTGSITDGQALLVDYSHGGYTSNTVLGGTDSTGTYRFLMIGSNLADDSDVTVEVYQAVVAPDTEVDFLSEEFVEITLNGKAVVPEGGTAAYEINTDIVDA